MAHPLDQRTRSLAPSTDTLFQWGVAATCTAFLWSLISVASQVWPTTFPAVVPNPSLGQLVPMASTSFALISPTLDRLILLVCSASVLVILEDLPLGYVRRAVLMLPVLLIACFVLLSETTPLLSSVLLLIGAAGTVAGVLYLVLHGSELLEVTPARLLSSILVLLAASTAIVFSVSGVRWVLNAFNGGVVPLEGWTWSPSALGLKLLNLPYWLMPGLFLLCFTSWVIRLILGARWTALKGYFARLSLRFTAFGDGGTGWQASRWLPLILVLASLAGSLLVGVYPYLHTINPKSEVYGTDVQTSYYPDLQQMLSLGPFGAIGYAYRTYRGGFLLLQYLLALLTGSADLAIRVVPPVLTVLLVVSTYFFVRTGVKDRLLAATAALFAAFSFEVVTGINGGFDSSWLAVSEALVFLSLLLAGLERSDMKYVALSIVVSLFIAFTHPWAWLTTMGAVAVYLFLTTARALVVHDRRNLRFELIAVGSIFIVNFAIDGVKLLLGSWNGVQFVLGTTSSDVSLSNIPTVLSSLALMVRYFLAGSFDNSLIVILAIVGVFTIPDLGSRMNMLLLSWMAVASGGVLLYANMARIILLVPLQVLCAMGFLSLLGYLTGLMSAGGHENRWLVRAFVALAYISVLGVLLSYALQNVGVLIS